MVCRVYLYKRGSGLVKELVVEKSEISRFMDVLKEKYDGIIVCDKDCYVKAMYGYCGI